MQVKKQQLKSDMEQWSGCKLGKEYIKAAYCLLANLYAEYSMQNARLGDAQTGIKIARRNINNLRYEDDATLMENEEKQKSLLMRVKSRVKKLAWNQLQKVKIMVYNHNTSWQIDVEKAEAVTDFIFLGSKTTVDGDYSH